MTDRRQRNKATFNMVAIKRKSITTKAKKKSTNPVKANPIPAVCLVILHYINTQTILQDK